ncbi:MAG: hypothetical protein ACRC5C_07775, partial [Bacilli bacterium]
GQLGLEGEVDVRTGEWALLERVRAPGIVIQLGYLTNRDESALLITEPFQQMCAQAIGSACAVVREWQRKSEIYELYCDERCIAKGCTATELFAILTNELPLGANWRISKIPHSGIIGTSERKVGLQLNEN